MDNDSKLLTEAYLKEVFSSSEPPKQVNDFWRPHDDETGAFEFTAWASDFKGQPTRVDPWDRPMGGTYHFIAHRDREGDITHWSATGLAPNHVPVTLTVFND